MLHLVEELANLINRQPIAGQQTVHDRITEKVIKRRFGSSSIHDKLQTGMMGLWIPFETFPPVVYGVCGSSRTPRYQVAEVVL